MKRVIRTKTIFEETWTIEILPKEATVDAGTILDTSSNEYAAFIKGMIVAFMDAGYELYNDPDYTHSSNLGSESWYYTFIRVEDYVEIRIVVNVRVSSHSNSDRPWGTAQELRARYVDRSGDQLANEFQVSPKPLKVPVEIIFNDDNFTSYNQALFSIHDTLEELEKDYQTWRKTNGLST